MQTVECYKTSDGVLHESKEKAIAYQDDLIGAEVMSLFTCLNLDFGIRESSKGVLSALINRAELIKIISAILVMLHDSENDETKAERIARLKKQLPHYKEYIETKHG